MNELEQFVSQSFSFGEKPVALHKNKLSDVITKISDNTLDGRSIEANLWLPYAAHAYDLSRDIRDYVIVPVPVMWTSIPNTNGDSVSLSEFMKFNPSMGMQAFKTFRGKPCHLEHANKDIKKAKGVILDVFMRPIKKFGKGKYYKLVELMAYDRSKDSQLVDSILAGENNAYSVGFYYNAYSCSVCNHAVGVSSNQPCSHTRIRMKPYLDKQRRVVYRQCMDVIGFETSVVKNPAFISAVSDIVHNPRNL